MGNGMNKILEGLYIGNFSDSRSSTQLEENSITHVVSVYGKPSQHFKHIKYLLIEAEDTPSQILDNHFISAAKFIHKARSEKGNVLVHCMAGVSRSVTITAAYIVTITDLTWKQAINAIKGSRRVASPNFGFQKQLQAWCETELTECKERMKIFWPKVDYDDATRCTELLALYAEWVKNGDDDMEEPDDLYPLGYEAYKEKTGQYQHGDNMVSAKGFRAYFYSSAAESFHKDSYAKRTAAGQESATVADLGLGCGRYSTDDHTSMRTNKTDRETLDNNLTARILEESVEVVNTDSAEMVSTDNSEQIVLTERKKEPSYQYVENTTELHTPLDRPNTDCS